MPSESESDHSSSNRIDNDADTTSGEDLITHRGLIQDYQPIPELDTYGSTGITDSIYTEENSEARLAADREIKRLTIQRLRREGKRIPINLITDSEDEISRYLRTAGTGLDGLKPGELPPKSRGLSLEELEFNQENLPLLLTRQDVQTEIKKRFRRFLTTFTSSTPHPTNSTTSNKNSNFSKVKSETPINLAANQLQSVNIKIYVEAIHRMCCDNKRSLQISYNHLRESEEILALFLADEPTIMIRLFDFSLIEIVSSLYPNYIGPIVDDLSVRIIDVPVCDSLRDLRTYHLNGLVRVSGIVTKRSSPVPVIKLIRVSCKNCGSLSPTQLNTISELEGLRCETCNGGWFELNDSHTKFDNYQELVIQESPNSIPPGRIPRSIKINVSADQVDSVKPGQAVDVTGVYCYKQQNSIVSKSVIDSYNDKGITNYNKKFTNKKKNVETRFPIIGTQILTNSIQLLESTPDFALTQEDEEEIKKLSLNKNIINILTNSFAPSIHGHQNTKLALLLSLVGGVAKDASVNPQKSVNQSRKPQTNMRIRGDINVLLIGDPGTAKSQFLKHAAGLSARGIYTAGKVASAAGLTATVKVDPLTKEWALEGGALVLADKGLCCIDEFDKMTEQDRTSIHEAMEQQTISVSKAGIVATLSAQCSVIAAANPKRGYYDVSRSVAANLALTAPILSRFDLIIPVIDDFKPLEDAHLAEKISRNHCATDGNRFSNEDKSIINLELVKKYINYCKSKKPLLKRLNKNKLSSIYSKLRAASYNIAGSIKIAVRHVESVIRIAEGFAKLKLKNFVDNEDLDRAIQLVLVNFIDGQKFGVKKRLKNKFRGYLNYNVEENKLLGYLLEDLVKEKIKINKLIGNEESEIKVEVKELERRGKEIGCEDVGKFLGSEEFKEYKFGIDESKKYILINK